MPDFYFNNGLPIGRATVSWATLNESPVFEVKVFLRTRAEVRDERRRSMLPT